MVSRCSIQQEGMVRLPNLCSLLVSDSTVPEMSKRHIFLIPNFLYFIKKNAFKFCSCKNNLSDYVKKNCQSQGKSWI